MSEPAVRIGSLFSGAGGLDLAALSLFPGSKMAWHAEIHPAASKVLAHHWPTVPNLGDIERVGLDCSDEEWLGIKASQAQAAKLGHEFTMPQPDWTAVEPVDVLTGGFPCQDVSVAGLSAGLNDGTRSGLWSHFANAIRVLRPRYVLIENVRGLLSAPAIRGVESDTTGLGDRSSRPVLRALGAVLGDLAGLGFDAEWTCVRASDVGACHRRERVFILAWPADPDRDALRIESEPESRSSRPSIARGDRSRTAGGVDLLPTPSVADATGGHKTRSGPRGDELLLPGVAIAHAGSALLPTSRATDGTKGGPNQRGSSGDLMLPSAVASLLPTPRASDAAGGPNPLARAERMDDVETRVIRLAGQWGKYAAAIDRHELASRAAAPAPTELSRAGNPRLAPAFAEWMMMWPAGWVSAPEIGLSRNDQLRCIGNGVVPAQAARAFAELIYRSADGRRSSAAA